MAGRDGMAGMAEGLIGGTFPARSNEFHQRGSAPPHRHAFAGRAMRTGHIAAVVPLPKPQARLGCGQLRTEGRRQGGTQARHHLVPERHWPRHPDPGDGSLIQPREGKMTARTLYDKVVDAHTVRDLGAGRCCSTSTRRY